MRPGAASVPDLITLVPERLLKRSGKIFYSARHAFESPARPLYILGLNPGGRPGAHAYETIAANIDQTLHREQDDWSAYVHESWSGRPVGTAPFQRRMQYLFVKGCGINLGRVPASNLVFQRSRRTQFLGTPFKELALACWPFHKAVIARLGIRVIVCLGAPASDFVL